jgi:hypothetical protein
MDPDSTLKTIRDLLDEYYHGDVETDTFAEYMAEAVNNMDEWLSKGGFKPKGWE